MHKRSSVLLALLLAVSASAQTINYLAYDSRVTVAGFAQAGSMPANHYSGAGPQSRVAGEATAFCAGAGLYGLDVSARASSCALGSFSRFGTGLKFFAMTQATTSSQYGTWGGTTCAEGAVWLKTSFNVSSTMAYTLSLDQISPFRSAAPYGVTDFACSLSSTQDGWLGGWSSSGAGSWPNLFSGLFEPGQTYTFEALVRASADLPDPLGEMNTITFGVSLTQVPGDGHLAQVPEPSAGALFGGGLLSLALARRKRA
jgi:hypothetical protein